MMHEWTKSEMIGRVPVESEETRSTFKHSDGVGSESTELCQIFQKNLEDR